MQLSTITQQVPFIGREKHQRGTFWNLAQSQTRFIYNLALKYAGNRYDAGYLVQETLYTREVTNVDQWFTQRLGYAVRLPGLTQLGLNLLGGRKCALGKIDAALLFCNSNGKRVSIFCINQNDVDIRFGENRKYIVEEGGLKVTLWKESGLVYAMVI